MSLLKFMIAGLAITATCGASSHFLWGQDAALATTLIVGIITQHGALLAAAFGWPNYGAWGD